MTTPHRAHSTSWPSTQPLTFLSYPRALLPFLLFVINPLPLSDLGILMRFNLRSNPTHSW